MVQWYVCHSLNSSLVTGITDTMKSQLTQWTICDVILRGYSLCCTSCEGFLSFRPSKLYSSTVLSHLLVCQTKSSKEIYWFSLVVSLKSFCWNSFRYQDSIKGAFRDGRSLRTMREQLATGDVHFFVFLEGLQAMILSRAILSIFIYIYIFAWFL